MAARPPPVPPPAKDFVIRKAVASERARDLGERRSEEVQNPSAGSAPPAPKLGKAAALLGVQAPPTGQQSPRPGAPSLPRPSAAHVQRAQRLSARPSTVQSRIPGTPPGRVAGTPPSRAQNEKLSLLSVSRCAVGGVTKAVGKARSRAVGGVLRAGRAAVKAKHDVVSGAKRKMFKSLQSALGKRLAELYTHKIKLSLTPDRRMPFALRAAVHELADEIWENVQIEVTRALDKIITQSGEEESSTASVPTCSPPPSPPEEDMAAADDAREAGRITGGDAVRGKGVLVVTLLRGVGLLAADSNGLSDPFVKLSVGAGRGTTRYSKVARKTLSPEWRQSFEWRGDAAALLSAPLRLDVWDHDRLTQNDPLGKAETTLAELASSPGVAATRALPLTTQGSITVEVLWSWAAATGSAPSARPQPLVVAGEGVAAGGEGGDGGGGDVEGGEEASSDGGGDGDEDSGGRGGEAASARGVLTVVLHRARGLMASDSNGRSDPYAKLTVGRRQRRSSVVPKTLSPEWGQTFRWYGRVDRLLATTSMLRVAVWDRDMLSLDDALGDALVPLASLLGAAVVEQPFCLSTQGVVVLSLSWESGAAPSRSPFSRLLGSPPPPAAQSASLPKSCTGAAAAATPSPPPPARGLAGRMRALSFVSRTESYLRDRLSADSLRRSLLFAEVRITVTSAKRLLRADRGGTSDPYCKLSIGHGQQARTSVVHKTIDPVWDETFLFEGTLRQLLSKPLELDIFDEDVHPLDSTDDWLGSTEYDLAPLFASQARSPAWIPPAELSLPLCTRGTVQVTVQTSVLTLGPLETLRKFFDPLLVAARAAAADHSWEELQRRFTLAKVVVRMHGASGILASDSNGLSDPFLKVALGRHSYTTRTIKKTINPTWEESFAFTMTVAELVLEPLEVQLYDEDLFSAPDYLGAADYDFEEHLAATPAAELSSPRRTSLPFDTQGALDVSISIELEAPTFTQIGLSLLAPLLGRFRAFILYQRMPYDRAIWSKVRDPWYFVVMMVAASPDVFLRGGFFTVFLLCVATDREEYQVMRFILALKGTQFISGLLKLFTVCFGFWECTVLTTTHDGCFTTGPGVGNHVLYNMAMLLWLQLLVWTAFAMLPFSTTFDRNTGTLSDDRANAAWLRLPAGQRHSSSELAGQSASKGSRRGTVSPRHLVGSLARAGGGALRKVAGPLGKAKGSFARGGSHELGGGHVSGGDLEAGETPGQDGSGGGAARARQLDDLICGAWSVLKQLGARASVVRQVMEEQLAVGNNRMFSLLKWDMFAFGSCSALFLLMIVSAMHVDDMRQIRDASGEPGALQEAWMFLIGLPSIFTMTFWHSWEVQITYNLVKLLFMLSAAPFFVFTIGGLNSLFSHTDPTAYNAQGRIVAMDLNGLSSYLDWIVHDVLESTIYRAELKALPADELQRLRIAVEQAEQLLQDASARPRYAMRMTNKKKAKIDELLGKLVTKERVSPALYKHCFPDRLLVDKYKEKLEAQVRLLQKREEEQKQRVER